MSTWADLQPMLRIPILGTGEKVVYPGFDETEIDELRTGDPSDAATWILYQSMLTGSEYGTFSGDSQRYVYGQVSCRIFGEPVAGDKPLWDIAETLETAYTGQDSDELIFHIARAFTNEAPYVDGSWLRLEWRLPFLWFKETT